MAETPAITDRNLEATTHISLKREPACFAFLSARSVAPPMPIDSINLDLASADYFNGRASLWTTLEMRSSINNDRPTAILGFDESFLRPFARALVEASTTRAAYRMTILGETGDSDRCRVVEASTRARANGRRKLSSNPRIAVARSLLTEERISSVVQSDARPLK